MVFASIQIGLMWHSVSYPTQHFIMIFKKYIYFGFKKEHLSFLAGLYRLEG